MLYLTSMDEVLKSTYKAKTGVIRPMINWQVVSEILATDQVLCIAGSYALWIAEVTNNSDRQINWIPGDIDVYTTNFDKTNKFISSMGYMRLKSVDEDYGEYPFRRVTKWKIFDHHDDLYMNGDSSKTIKVDPSFMHEINVIDCSVKVGYYGNPTPRSVMATFDLTICQATLVESDGSIYLQTSAKFEEDFNRRRMRFCTPTSWETEESGCVTEQRVIKYIQRGYILEKEIWWGEQERLWLEPYVNMDNELLEKEIGIVFEVA